MATPAMTLRALVVRLFLRWSVRRGVIAITVASVLLSILLTAVLVRVLFGNDDVVMGRSLAIAGMVSLVVAPLMSFSVLRLVHELELARAEVHAAAITDSLTGVRNRRFFMEAGRQMLAAAGQGATALSVVIFDIDDFKSINDRHGHAAGDAVLGHVGDAAQRCLRADDVLARIGGEEFAVLLPGAGAQEGIEVAERIRAAIAAASFAHADGERQAVTVSVGVAAFDRHASFDALLQAADAALYRAKAAGKNRCCAA